MTDKAAEEIVTQTGLTPVQLAAAHNDEAFKVWLMNQIINIRTEHASCQVHVNEQLKSLSERMIVVETWKEVTQKTLNKAVAIAIGLVASGAAGEKIISKVVALIAGG